MQGYARAVLKDHSHIIPNDAVEALKRIERAAHRLDLLVCDILSFSKVAKADVELKPITLEPLLFDILEQHSELRASRNHISVETPLHSVLGHEAYLSQCLTNLLENALKFTEPGAAPAVRVGSEPAGNMIRINVTDHGIGIAPEHHDRIFQIFGRVYSEKRYPGTGIGLAIVKKAVHRMGGEAGFESQPGKGTTFWFTLRQCANGTNGH